jgi:hypothetical protein
MSLKRTSLAVVCAPADLIADASVAATGNTAGDAGVTEAEERAALDAFLQPAKYVGRTKSAVGAAASTDARSTSSTFQNSEHESSSLEARPAAKSQPRSAIQTIMSTGSENAFGGGGKDGGDAWDPPSNILSAGAISGSRAVLGRAADGSLKLSNEGPPSRRVLIEVISDTPAEEPKATKGAVNYARILEEDRAAQLAAAKRMMDLTTAKSGTCLSSKNFTEVEG